MSVKINIEIKGLKKLQSAWRKSPLIVYRGLTWAINKSAWEITKDVKAATPVKTGTLKRGIRPEFGKLRAVIKPHNAPYAIYVHQGSKAHMIFPRRRQALYWKGAMHPVKKVRHPGYRGNPFMVRGAKNAQGKVNKTFSKALDKIISQL
jgi:hypothetical protein